MACRLDLPMTGFVANDCVNVMLGGLGVDSQETYGALILWAIGEMMLRS